MRKGMFLVLAMLMFAFGQAPLTSAAAEPIEEVRNLIDVYYVEKVPDSTLDQETISEITDQLDPYSVYMSKEEFERFNNAVNQELVGIGIVLEEHEQGVQVMQTLPNSPAEEAGILPGDIITKANEKSLKGVSVETSVSYITGEEHTTVTITFLQKSSGKLKTATLERRRISIPNVESQMLGGDIGYIRLYSFSMDAAEEIQEAILDLEDAKGFIFDLRDNGGGYVSAAQDIIGLFPKATDAFQLKERDNAPFLYDPTEQDIQFSEPIHILVNENSASASEMVSASVKEQKAAVLYGQNTFGKGSMQGLFQLSDDSVMKLTTAKFQSPNGQVIDGVGVMPSIETAVGEELVMSHRDQLLNMHAPYKKLPTLKNVETTKTFTVKMNMDMNWDEASPSDLQLIHLGGEEVETELTIVDDRKIKVTPKEPLLSEETYMLVIHPEWVSESNISMTNGSLVEITVE